MNKFKISDKVFATKNDYWGARPCVIVKEWLDINRVVESYSVEHPTLGIGAFPKDELKIYTPKAFKRRQLEIRLFKAKELVKDLEAKIYKMV